MIIGKQVGELTCVLMKKPTDEVTVSLVEIKNDWKYSNPTGLYNLSTIGTAHHSRVTYRIQTYPEWKKEQEPEEEE